MISYFPKETYALRQFTKKQEQFKWRKYHQEELDNLKSELLSNSLLKYFKPDMPTHIYMLTHIKQGSLQTSPDIFDLAYQLFLRRIL